MTFKFITTHWIKLFLLLKLVTLSQAWTPFWASTTKAASVSSDTSSKLNDTTNQWNPQEEVFETFYKTTAYTVGY